MLATTFGFAMIWYMWWLAVVSFIGIIVCVISISFSENTEFTIPAEEVQETEEKYFEKLIKASV
jgi:cytochrome o ubiquinol oxidase subunit 1